MSCSSNDKARYSHPEEILSPTFVPNRLGKPLILRSSAVSKRLDDTWQSSVWIWICKSNNPRASLHLVRPCTVCVGRGQTLPRSTLASAPRGHFLLCSRFCTKPPPPPPLPPNWPFGDCWPVACIGLCYISPSRIEGEEETRIPSLSPFGMQPGSRAVVWTGFRCFALNAAQRGLASSSTPYCTFPTLIFWSGSFFWKVSDRKFLLQGYIHPLDFILRLSSTGNTFRGRLPTIKGRCCNKRGFQNLVIAKIGLIGTLQCTGDYSIFLGKHLFWGGW